MLMPCNQSHLFLQPYFGCGFCFGPNVQSMGEIDWMQMHKLKAKSHFWQIYWLSIENAMTPWYYSVNQVTRIRTGSNVKPSRHRLTA